MIKIQARTSTEAEILVYSPIGEDWLGNGVTAKKFRDELDALGGVQTITVRINSPGGEVFDGLAIANALREHSARKVVHVDGLAASIASVIAMAGDEINMGLGSMMMIHSPWALALGNAEQMRKQADTLDKVEAGMAAIYVARSKQSDAIVREWMKAETWFTAQEAVDAGLADRIASDEAESIPLAQDASKLLARFAKLPPRIAAMVNPRAALPTLNARIAAEPDERRRDIMNVFGRFADEYEPLMADCLKDARCTAQDASNLLLAQLSARAEPIRDPVGGNYSGRNDDFALAACDALLMRAGIQIERPHAAARDLRHTSIVDLARSALSRTGRSVRGLAPSQIVASAMTTSDFPSILENVISKSLRNGYEADEQSHRAWVRPTSVPDFKPASRLLLGSAPALAVVPEMGEYTHGSMLEDKATIQVRKFGKLVRFSWESLVNDDLAAFSRVPQALGAAARRAEADEVYNLFAANTGSGPTMQDAATLFHATHNNISATVGAISVNTLGAARSLLRRQVALGGGFMNLRPRFLITSAQDETLAETVMALASRHQSGTASTSNNRLDVATPDWINGLQLVVEPRLDPSRGFYVAASYNQCDTAELATLDEAAGAPMTETESVFVDDSMTTKIKHVFGVKFVDWRGIVRVPVS